MPVNITVLYPQGAKFDMSYYLSKHMPLVQSKWSSYGLKSWTVTQYPGEAPHTVGATLVFDSMGDFQKAGAGPEIGEVMGDVKNFSDKDPIIMPGEVVGTS